MAMKNKDEIPEEFKESNPFVTGQSFEQLIRVVAVVSKTVVRASSSSGEAVNAMLSVIVTMLKNVPDHLWELMKKTATAEDQNDVTRNMFNHLDGLRSYIGENYDSWEESGEEVFHKMVTPMPTPGFTAKPPKHTQ